jgi:hypothetical protein
MTNAGTPGTFATPRSEDNSGNTGNLATKPSTLCRWTIHAAIRTRYEEEDDKESDQDPEAIAGSDGNEPMLRWPFGNQQTFEEKLQGALENSSFSTMKGLRIREWAR